MDANRPASRRYLPRAAPAAPATLGLALLVATACTTQTSPVVGPGAPVPPPVAELPSRPAHAPGWVAYRRPAGPPISLSASNGTGLALAELDARAVIEEPLAFTEMRLAFDNPQNRTLEGTFSITLPPGAAISRFAMKTPGGWQEGEVVEKKAARAAYEDFLHRKQDPALLEQAAGNQFSARVFPIPARGRKELIVSYSQELTAAAPYVVPMQGLPAIQAVHVEVSRDGEPMGRFERTAFVPDRDFDLDPGQLHDGAGLRSGDLAVVRVRPVLDAPPDPLTSAVFLVDTSASRALGFESELSLVEGLVHAAAASQDEARVAVVAFDQTADVVFEGRARAFGSTELSALRERGALGASDLGGAMTKAGGVAKKLGARRVVLISDGVATAFVTDADALGGVAGSLREFGVERLDAVAVGGIHDDAVLKRVATSGLPRDGAVLDGGQDVTEVARRLNLATRSGIAVDVEGARFFYPRRIDGAQPGDEVLIYAELDAESPMRLSVGGAKVDTASLVPVERPLLGRAMAQAKIADLLDTARHGERSAALEQQVVALSTQYRVLSPYTSMLVLETEADYDRFHIDRRSLSDILTVTDGRLALHQRAGSPLMLAEDNKDLAKSAMRALAPSTHAAAQAAPAAAAATAAPASRDEAQEERRERPTGGAPAAADVPAGAPSLQPLSGTATAMASATPAMSPPPPPPASPAPLAGESDTSALGLSGTGEGGGGNLGGIGSIGHGAGAMAPQTEATRAANGPAMRSAPSPARGRLMIATPEPPPTEKPAAGDAYTGNLKGVMDALAHGDKDRALGQATRWQHDAPGDVLALVALGEAEEAGGDVPRASRVYGSIIDLFSARADLRRFAGARLERLHSEAALALAEDSYEKAEAERPDHPSSHRLLAFARLRQGRFAEAFDAARVGAARIYPAGRFPGVDQILREDMGLIAAAWINAEPGKRESILSALRQAGGKIEDAPSIRFVLTWETDANDVDFHIYDNRGGHAFYGRKHLASGGDLYADITTGYGPECFTIRQAKSQRASKYTLQANYYSRGPMGYGMGKLEIIDHDGKGGLSFEERPYVVMKDHAFVDLGTVTR